MRSKVLWSLAVLNLVLVVALLLKLTPGSPAYAQVRRPSDYLMIPATIPGGNNGVMYIIDMSNGLLGAASYDDARKTLDPMPPIDLMRIFAADPGAAPPGPAPRGR